MFFHPPFFSVPHFDFAQYPPGRFCGSVSFAVEWESPSEVRAQEVPVATSCVAFALKPTEAEPRGFC